MCTIFGIKRLHNILRPADEGAKIDLGVLFAFVELQGAIHRSPGIVQREVDCRMGCLHVAGSEVVVCIFQILPRRLHTEADTVRAARLVGPLLQTAAAGLSWAMAKEVASNKAISKA